MPDWSVFIDENWSLDPVTVVGALVPGTPAPVEARLREVIRAHFGPLEHPHRTDWNLGGTLVLGGAFGVPLPPAVGHDVADFLKAHARPAPAPLRQVRRGTWPTKQELHRFDEWLATADRPFHRYLSVEAARLGGTVLQALTAREVLGDGAALVLAEASTRRDHWPAAYGRVLPSRQVSALTALFRRVALLLRGTAASLHLHVAAFSVRRQAPRPDPLGPADVADLFEAARADVPGAQDIVPVYPPAPLVNATATPGLVLADFLANAAGPAARGCFRGWPKLCLALRERSLGVDPEWGEAAHRTALVDGPYHMAVLRRARDGQRTDLEGGGWRREQAEHWFGVLGRGPHAR